MLWPLAHVFSALPGGIVAALLTDVTSPNTRLIFVAALAWLSSAVICSNVLGLWHAIAKGFSPLTLSTTFTIAAIVGPVAGLMAVALAHSTPTALFAFGAAFLGALQGAGIVWLVVGPDLQPPPAPCNDEEANDEHPPNPPTPTP